MKRFQFLIPFNRQLVPTSIFIFDNQASVNEKQKRRFNNVTTIHADPCDSANLPVKNSGASLFSALAIATPSLKSSKWSDLNVPSFVIRTFNQSIKLLHISFRLDSICIRSLFTLFNRKMVQKTFKQLFYPKKQTKFCQAKVVQTKESFSLFFIDKISWSSTHHFSFIMMEKRHCGAAVKRQNWMQLIFQNCAI